MAKKTVTAVLVKNLDLKGFCQFADGLDHFIGFLIFDLARFDGNQSVTAFFVSSHCNITVSHMLISSMDFVPVIIRIFHTKDRLRFSIVL